MDPGPQRLTGRPAPEPQIPPAVDAVPLSAFSAALVQDGVPVEALTCWLDTGRCWHARSGVPAPFRTTGRASLTGTLVSLTRPRGRL
jgi:myo-inositol-1(or 4)-monophosphatase